MKYHHHGYVSSDPRIQPPAGAGIDRPEDLPDQVDVLIVGAGPAGMIAAAQLSQFPGIVTRIVERRAGRLEIGLADGMQKRSIETFEAFGFAQQLIAEACQVTETAFWKPDPAQPENIVRVSRVDEDPQNVSEYPHLTVNHARVLDYFAEFMENAPTRMKPDYGYEFVGLTVADEGDHPVTVTLKRSTGDHAGEERVVRARYVLGSDGAHSGVRKAIGQTLRGVSSNHAWGVMDLLADTDFPDIRTKCAIQSESDGNILLIPREGGFLFRVYVDLGDVAPDDGGAIRRTPVEQIIARAQRIFHPYRLDVRHVAWHSVYEVGHRLCDHFDDVPPEQVGHRMPRVFIAGDASHTHSAKAGQGTNASMQDGFNLGWKLGHVLEGRSPAGLLDTYSAERQKVGQSLIDQDLRWATQMAKSAEAFASHAEFEQAYLRITEFAQGFMTQYEPSMITLADSRQALATGYPVGKRFRSAEVMRVADANRLHLGHEARADGRWRIYVFADAARAGEDSPLAALGRWLDESPDSPIRGYTPAGLDENAWFDVKVVYQQDHTAVDIGGVPRAFLPRVGPYQLTDLENVYAALPDQDIFQLRGIDRQGAIVIVRPDQYVAGVLALTDTDALAGFLRTFAIRQR
ncbi:2-polyprenyl-6-methoxyphenol hydroxylase [Castellaniella defragrans 65Phen]|uniref:2-polyprenyl-6-methoxyphenol hydroxylase n=1 Tax=Castellaniella defragrans (strain DSM 12143 / CCUG 39792 / 65Phen) TaxID=1437824 RepID=W8X9B0_CASD6|nr:FAD-dependent monooxygenase [Castellaniella defragrans]CDM24510.1 2-polyprenyl-6-methoxyphenol hydroxylase [Castellaniella defragrans 65Phen]